MSQVTPTVQCNVYIIVYLIISIESKVDSERVNPLTVTPATVAD